RNRTCFLRMDGLPSAFCLATGNWRFRIGDDFVADFDDDFYRFVFVGIIELYRDCIELAYERNEDDKNASYYLGFLYHCGSWCIVFPSVVVSCFVVDDGSFGRNLFLFV